VISDLDYVFPSLALLHIIHEMAQMFLYVSEALSCRRLSLYQPLF